MDSPIAQFGCRPQAPSDPPSPGIGFVLHERPARAEGGRPQGRRSVADLPQTAIRNRRIGFVLHNRPPDTRWPSRNWLRLHHRPPAPAGPLSEIGFVLHDLPLITGGSLKAFDLGDGLPFPPIHEIGFVLPRHSACQMCHNPFPIKHLSLPAPCRKLASFRRNSLHAATTGTESGPSQVRRGAEDPLCTAKV
jgi:hypothetical protein